MVAITETASIRWRVAPCFYRCCHIRARKRTAHTRVPGAEKMPCGQRPLFRRRRAGSSPRRARGLIQLEVLANCFALAERDFCSGRVAGGGFPPYSPPVLADRRMHGIENSIHSVSNMCAHRRVRGFHRRSSHCRRKLGVETRWKAALLGGRVEQPVKDQHLFSFDGPPKQRIAANVRNTKVKTHVISVDRVHKISSPPAMEA